VTAGRTALLLLTLALLPPLTLAAQGWRVEAAAGRAVHDPVQARVGSTVASVGLSYDGGSARWLYLSAGSPLDGAGPAWGAGGAGGWLGFVLGDWSLGAALGAHAFGYGSADSVRSGGGGTVEVLPTLSWAHGLVRAELSAGFVGNLDVVDDTTRRRGALDTGARLAYAPAPGVEVAGEGRYLVVEGERWPYAGAALQVERGPVTGWAYAGQWMGRDSLDPATAYGAGAGYRIDRRTRVEIGVRQEPTDPVYLSTPRRTWSVQLSRAIGRVRDEEPAGARAAAPSLAPEVVGGTATFRLPAAPAEANAPVLLGDFNSWRPVAMTRAGAFWTATVPVGPGAHHYAFRRADGTVVVPPGVPTVDDGFGGVSAVLLVP